MKKKVKLLKALTDHGKQYVAEDVLEVDAPTEKFLIEHKVIAEPKAETANKGNVK